MDGLAELRDPDARRRVLDAERLVLLAEPPRAESELEAAAAHVVESGCRLRGERRMAERVACDELGELHPPRDHGQRAEEREALEHRVVGRFHRAPHEEVIRGGDRVVARGLRALGEVAHLGERTPGQLNAEARPPHRRLRVRRVAVGAGGRPSEAWSTR